MNLYCCDRNKRKNFWKRVTYPVAGVNFVKIKNQGAVAANQLQQNVTSWKTVHSTRPRYFSWKKCPVFPQKNQFAWSLESGKRWTIKNIIEIASCGWMYCNKKKTQILIFPQLLKPTELIKDCFLIFFI